MDQFRKDLLWAISFPLPPEPHYIGESGDLKSLASALLVQTHQDATRNKVMRPGGWKEANKLRREALEFLFSDDPDITATRVFWCAQTGTHPRFYRNQVVVDANCLLNGGKRISRTGKVKCPEGGTLHGATGI